MEQRIEFTPPWRMRCPGCRRMVQLTVDAERGSGHRCPRCGVRLRRVSVARVVAVLGGGR